MIRVILHGACGHMGQVVRNILDGDPEMTITAGIDAFPKDAPFPVYPSAAECTEEADVLIDFSTAAAIDDLLAFGVERKIPLVICTTGLSDAQLMAVSEASEKVAVLRSSNMSLGINTVAKLIAEAAKVLYPAGFDMEIEEMHHRRKIDAPSGTAILLADSLNDAVGGDLEYNYGRADRHAARPEKEIGISALRGGTVVGEHRVVFAGEDEVITVSHSAASRAIFANGAVAAAKFLAGKGPGLYTMKDVIG